MRRHQLVLLVVVGLVLAACSTSTKPSAHPSSTGAASPGASMGATTTATALTLQQMPTGTATLTWDPTTKVITASVNMIGFTPGSAHAMHIHTGSCLNQVNPPVIPFPDITASSTGAVSETVKSNAVAGGIPASGYLNIHLAPGATLGNPGSTSFTPIACADLPTGTATPGAPMGTATPMGTASPYATATAMGATSTAGVASKTGPVTLTMHALPQPGQHPSATATDSYDATAHTLTVDLNATGLPANTGHAVHIHSGSCTAQGPVVYPLNDLMADASGNASGTSTVTAVMTAPPASGWYLNIHMGSSATILSNGNPTLVFQPILCVDLPG